MPQQLQGRRGAVFSVRVTDEERAALDALRTHEGPRALGPWLVWRALGGDRNGTTAPASGGPGITRARSAAAVVPLQVRAVEVVPPPASRRVILDLCSGSGAWSEPYKRAGYDVVRVTLPKHDVRTYAPPVARVWGVLAAPPCTEFSLAKNGQARDFVEGMACVNACLRIVLMTRPQWWALENPVGMLRTFLGNPRDTFEPCDFGDPWTKRTAIWGQFERPKRGPYVKPARAKLAIDRDAGARAVTPPGFARAFFDANP